MLTLVIFLILALVVAIAIVLFAIYNTDVITINYIAWSFQTSMTAALLAIYGAGVVTTLLVLLPGIIRTRISLASKNKKIKDLAQTLPEGTFEEPKKKRGRRKKDKKAEEPVQAQPVSQPPPPKPAPKPEPPPPAPAVEDDPEATPIPEPLPDISDPPASEDE